MINNKYLFAILCCLLLIVFKRINDIYYFIDYYKDIEETINKNEYLTCYYLKLSAEFGNSSYEVKRNSYFNYNFSIVKKLNTNYKRINDVYISIITKDNNTKINKEYIKNNFYSSKLIRINKGRLGDKFEYKEIKIKNIKDFKIIDYFKFPADGLYNFINFRYPYDFDKVITIDNNEEQLNKYKLYKNIIARHDNEIFNDLDIFNIDDMKTIIFNNDDNKLIISNNSNNEYKNVINFFKLHADRYFNKYFAEVNKEKLFKWFEQNYKNNNIFKFPIIENKRILKEHKIRLIK